MCKFVDLLDKNTLSRLSTPMEGFEEYTMGHESEGTGGILSIQPAIKHIDNVVILVL